MAINDPNLIALLKYGKRVYVQKSNVYYMQKMQVHQHHVGVCVWAWKNGVLEKYYDWKSTNHIASECALVRLNKQCAVKYGTVLEVARQDTPKPRLQYIGGVASQSTPCKVPLIGESSITRSCMRQVLDFKMWRYTDEQ